jgi:hypothetical protein
VNCCVKLLGWLGAGMLGILTLSKEVRQGVDLRAVDRSKLAGSGCYCEAAGDGFAARYGMLPSIMRGLLERQ